MPAPGRAGRSRACGHSGPSVAPMPATGTVTVWAAIVVHDPSAGAAHTVQSEVDTDTDTGGVSGIGAIAGSVTRARPGRLTCSHATPARWHAAGTVSEGKETGR